MVNVEKRMTTVEKRVATVEKRMTTVEKRMTTVEKRLTDSHLPRLCVSHRDFIQTHKLEVSHVEA